MKKKMNKSINYEKGSGGDKTKEKGRGEGSSGCQSRLLNRCAMRGLSKCKEERERNIRVTGYKMHVKQ